MSRIFSRHLVLDKKKDGKICVIFWYKEGTLNVIQHNSNKYFSPLTPKKSPFWPLPDPLPPQAADSMTNTFLSLFKNVL